MENSTQNSFSGLPPASLIICSRNRPQLLIETVESVLSGVATPAELIVIDQSDHKNDWFIKHPCILDGSLRYIWTRTKGLCRARNIGIAEASCRIIVFTDDDMLVASTWFAELIKAVVQSGQRAVVTGRVLPAAPEKPGGFVETIVTSQAPKIYQGRINMDILVGAQMAMYYTAIQEIGFFDERLGVGGAIPGSG